ncbi:putative Ras and EF-hand domain-containing protein [Naja naja]|nr:putative Ras and EF-hand domain-containing protein [Naja naja]
MSGVQQQSQDEAFRTAPDRIFKIVLVGNSAVGKTSFLKQFCEERYRSITKQFFRKADGVVVMYDVTAQETFVAVKQWLVSVEEAAGENIPVLLLGNKVDKEKERAVPKRLGEHLAKDYSIIFYECSALTGENIKAPILQLARILKEQEDNVKEKTVQLQQQPKKTTCCSRQ